MIPLWEPSNISMDSSIFRVNAGQAVLLFATGFAAKRYRETVEEVDAPQMACVNRLLLTSANLSEHKTHKGCDYVFDATNIRPSQAEDEVVFVDGCGWSLTACNNLRLIGVPGYYRLHLNDATAVGTAQVYADIYDAHNLPAQLAGLFF